MSDSEMMVDSPAVVDDTTATSMDVDPPFKVDKGKSIAPTSYDDNLPWVEKYRPVTLDDVVSHKTITSTIEKFIEKQRLPHMLFYGPPGTGKTSTILAVARRIYGKDVKTQTLELNASDERGIDVVRETVKNFAMTKSFVNKGFKLIILDEADMMTQAAQAALRRVIEQYTRNVRFCIICNYVNKITPAIQSRCTRFRFSPLPIIEVEKRLQVVIEEEKVKMDPTGLTALLKLSRGDMRRALNVLQACHAAYDTIDETAVYNCTGTPHPEDVKRLIESMMSDEFTTAYTFISQLKMDKGLALSDLLQSAYDFIDSVEFTDAARVFLLDCLGNTEHRLSLGGSEKMQLTGLLGSFKMAVEINSRK